MPVVIITDGLENSSREYTRAKIKAMIEHQRSVYNWKFTFLGANQDAFAEATSMGMPAASAVKYDEVKTSGGIALMSAGVLRARDTACQGKSFADITYTEEERRSVNN